jgi:hypothetical protein
MAKYEAQHIEGYRYLVIKRRWFGLAPSLYRTCVWDGYEYGNNHKPDFHWENEKEERTSEVAMFRARWAIIRVWKRVRGMVPAEWSTGLPTAKLLKGGT